MEETLSFQAWSKKNPIDAGKYRGLPPKTWQITHTGKKNEVNLVSQENGTPVYLLSPTNIESEMRYWLSTINISNIKLLVVYGLGMGYPYKALKTWLKNDSARRLFIVEDDEEVLTLFFRQEDSIDLIENPQVDLVFTDLKKMEDSFLLKIAKKYPFERDLITAIQSYETNKKNMYDSLRFFYEYMRYSFKTTTSEYLAHGSYYIKNAMRNFFRILESSNGNNFKGCFKGVPALIVGAGPSLQKNIDVLAKMKNKALILAGGTSINALNGFGIDPHIAIGVDPFDFFLLRTLSMTSFEIPFIYKMRMNKKALDNIHAPLIHVHGGTNYDIEKWFANTMKIEEAPIKTGTNVVNFALTLAHYFGCNPLITVGVDLAYSNEERYTKNLKKHASIVDRMKTKMDYEEPIVRQDINGKPVITLLKWVQESMWYSEYQYYNRNIQILNATEGGIGFLSIPNMPLSVINEKLTRTYDFDGWIHALSVTSPFLEGKKTLLNAFKHFLLSLERISKYFEKLKEEDLKNYEKKDISFEKELTQEEAFEHHLKEFSNTYDDFYKANLEANNELSPTMKNFESKIPFLQKTLNITLEELENGIDEAFESISELPIGSPVLIKHELTEQASRYYTEDGQLLSDFPLDKGNREGAAKLYYADGKLRADLNYSADLKEGSQTYYYQNGNVKSELNYKKDLLNGKINLYWPNGRLKRELEFKEGMREGMDKIYTPQGILDLESYYKEDLPFNQSISYHPNEQIKQKIIFGDKGKILTVTNYDETGRIIPKEELKTTDFYELLTTNLTHLADELLSVKKGLDGMSSVMGKKFNVVEINENLTRIEEEIFHLQKIAKELTREGGYDKNAPHEPIFKSGIMQEKINTQLAQATDQFRDLFQHLNFQLTNFKKKLNDSNKQ